jgi:hypothetical protein
MSCFTQRSLEGAGTPRTTAYPAGNYYLPPSPHLGREPMAPGWIRLPRGRGHDDRVWFIFTDPQPTEKMGATRHCRQLRPQTPALCWRGQGPSPLLQAGQCPHPPEIGDTGHKHYFCLIFWSGFCPEHTYTVQWYWFPQSPHQKKSSDTENDEKQKVISHGNDSHHILIGQSIQFFLPSTFHWL